MQTLFDKVSRGTINQLDALDITLSLAVQIEERTEFSHLDPTTVQLDEDNQVKILPGDGTVDCLFAAPDVVLENAPATVDSMRFSIGCLLFYMLTGKAYYDAYNLDPFEILEEKPGEGLVDPAVYTGRASDIVSALTAWAPDKRAQGMSKLMEAVSSAPAVITLQYMHNGQVVLTEQINVKEDLSNYRSNETVKAENGKTYTILPGATVNFRPGYHTVKIPVAPADGGSAGQTGNVAPPVSAQQGSTWLAVAFPNPSDASQNVIMRILPMDKKPHVKLLPVSLLRDTCYSFGTIQLGANGENLGGGKKLFHVNVLTEETARKRAFLKVSYHVSPDGVSVVLCDESNIPLTNTMHFKIN